MARFMERLVLVPLQYRHVFKRVVRTGDADAGDMKRERLREVIAVVGVVTNVYLEANADTDQRPSEGELAFFFDRAFGAELAARETGDCETKLEIFLAPLDPPYWGFPVRNVPLNDRRLTRLREDQFTWPSKAPADTVREIAQAVDDIVNGYIN
jgi:hypothetical protein